MKKKIKPIDNESNISNANKGTMGNNKQYSQKHYNRDKQLNPNNDAYWKARGHEKRPSNWKEIIIVKLKQHKIAG